MAHRHMEWHSDKKGMEGGRGGGLSDVLWLELIPLLVLLFLHELMHVLRVALGGGHHLLRFHVRLGQFVTALRDHLKWSSWVSSLSAIRPPTTIHHDCWKQNRTPLQVFLFFVLGGGGDSPPPVKYSETCHIRASRSGADSLRSRDISSPLFRFHFIVVPTTVVGKL